MSGPLPSRLRCDEPGCPDEVAVRVGAEQRCLAHALERANSIRAAEGRPSLVLAADGLVCVPH